MTTQIENQRKGENWIKTLCEALINCTTIDFGECIESKIRSNPVELYYRFPIEILRSIIFDEIINIFKVGTSESDSRKLTSCLIGFVSVSESMDRYRTRNNKKDKEYVVEVSRKYNKSLNLILQHIRTDMTDDVDILEKRNIISQMQMYKIGTFLFDGVDRTPQMERSFRDIERETRFQNYDGMKILTTNSVKMRIPETKNRLSGVQSQGVVFGFDTKEEFFTMICVAIENANIQQLNMDRCCDTVGGSLIHERVVFSLDLFLHHGLELDATIKSNSTKIMHSLCNNQVTHKSLRKILTMKPYIGAYQSLGLYIKFHTLVVKKIYDLINASFMKPEFPYISIQCYRPECNHRNIFDRPLFGISDNAQCSKCQISEFCLKCGKSSHGGLCDSTTDDWVVKNTKACPGCSTRVLKDGGCMHMLCPPCGTHFCWTCGDIYELNQINDHYTDLNPYGSCRGRGEEADDN